MKTQKGFTLIELLVVISIIALLLAILMPSLQRVKQQAQSVVCKTHLKQLTMAMVLLSEDNDSKAMTVEWYANVPIGKYWFFKLKPYLGLSSKDQFSIDEEMAVGFCPSTKAQTPPVSLMGTAKEYWAWQGAEGSYGVNLWATIYVISPTGTIYKPPSSIGVSWGRRLASIQNRVPIFGDCNWVGNIAQSIDAEPKVAPENYTVETGSRSLAPGGSNIGRYCIDRHNKAINMAFIDGHVETLPLEELWRIKWSKNFESTDVIIDYDY